MCLPAEFQEQGGEILRAMVRPNAGPHVARVCKQFLDDKDSDTTDRPLCSPDLNPIEQLWDVMYQGIHKLQHRLSRSSDALIQIWQEIPRTPSAVSSGAGLDTADLHCELL